MKTQIETEEPEFEFWSFVAMLRRRMPLIGLAAIVVTGTVVLWTMGLPKVYQATCSIEYDPTPPRPLGSEIEDVAAPLVNLWMSREWYQTQNRIIRSRSLAERVVRELGLATDPDFFGVPEEDVAEWEGRSVEEAATALQMRLTVDQIDETRIVQISFEDTNPERATLVVNTIADSFISRATEERLSSTLRALEDLSEQLDALRGELDRSEVALHEFKRDNNVLSVSLEDQQNNVAADLRRYSEALTATRRRRIEVASQLNSLRRAARDDPTGGNARLLMEHPSVQSLRRRAQEASEEVDSLRTRYGANWPAVREAEARRDRIVQDLHREVSGLVAAVGGELRQLQQQEAALSTELNAVRGQGHELNAHEIRFNELTREQENHAKLYGILLERTAETNMTRTFRVASVRWVDRALVPDEPIRPRMKVHVVVGLLAGLGFGIALAIFFSRLDRSLRSVEDLEGLGLTVIGALPVMAGAGGKPERNKYYGQSPPRDGPIDAAQKDLVVHTHPMSALAESTRTLRTNLTFMSADKPLQAISVASALPLEGKTTVAISLAIAMAQGGKKTLLIDTDLRRPRVHRAFGMSARVGATSVLVNDVEVRDAVQKSEVPGLWVLPSGPIPPNPSELLHSNRFAHLLAQAREQFDRIIFDSPPLGAVTDAAVVAPQIDGVILVVRANSTSRDAVRSSLRQLVDVRANILGGVLNNLDFSERGRYGGGRYYYSRGYYFRDGEDDLMDGPEPDDEARPSAV